MGNYKSRPSVSCADELKKKISESYSIFRSKAYEDLRPKDSDWSELQLACGRGDYTKVSELINEDNLNEKTDTGLSLLHIASINGGSRLLIELLLKKNVKSSALSKNLFSALHLAIYKGDIECVQCLLAAGVDVSQIGYTELSPLHIAAACGHVEITNILLENGAKVDAQDAVKFTPLHIACNFGHEKVVESLISHGADVNLPGGVGDRPLHLACWKGYLHITKMLVEKAKNQKADVNVVDDEQHRPIHFCCKSGHLMVLHYLLDQKAEPHVVNIYGDTPLHLACYNAKVEVVKQLVALTGSESLMKENLFSETPLHSACTNGRSLELIKYLLEQPLVSINYQGKDGHTGQDDIVTLLKHHKRPQDESACGDYAQPGGEGSYVSVPSPLGKLKSITRGEYRANSYGAKSDVDMFCREVAILSKLNSPYVINFVGACLDDPSQFAIVTEYVSGGSLYCILHEQNSHIIFQSE
ncbi:hypothetical protein KUTeg_021628 [Tegillarca granosa]|uniref:Protein kinase domain-containing protein n=1 Tax=Tegillarca granosa TaxID=220873 RepID=A0ABQ9E3V1_TEGGR|nr:hypothetical protein KUTeg_021628 [Tegillarca granosa]